MTPFIAAKPTTLPVSLAEFKAYLRITHTQEDQVILRILQSAVETVETDGRVWMMGRTATFFYDRFPSTDYSFDLPRYPLTAVSLLRYRINATWTTVSGGAYQLVQESERTLLIPTYGTQWPNVTPDAVEVQGTVGQALAANVPDDMKQAVQMLAAYRFRNREGPGYPPGYWEQIDRFRQFRFI